HGDLAAARKAYAEWSKLVPDDPRPRLVVLELAIQQGDEPAVHAAVDELKSVGGGDDLAYRLARAKELLFERDAAAPPPGSRDASLEEAARLVDSVVSDAPLLPAAQLVHAQVLERQGKFNDAIAAYERVWERGHEAALPRLVDLLT